MQQVGKVRDATQAAAAPLVQKASDGVKALLKLVRSSESGYFKEGDAQTAQIRQQLSSPNTETKLIGIRRALAAEAASGNGEYAEGPSMFFADVLKNLSTPDFELKRLVYLYLVQHAHQHPDLTLLAINGYQKDLYSSSHVVRSAALKSLSSLSMLEIVQLLVHSLKRAAADTSPLVRKTAAHAAAKLYYLDSDQREETVGVLLQLLGDGEIAVLGAALISFRLIFFQSLLVDAISPCRPTVNGAAPQGLYDVNGTGISSGPQEEALALLHPYYSRLVSILPQLQPAPQVVAVDLLTRYCRCFFKEPQPIEEGSQRGPQGVPQGETSGERGKTDEDADVNTQGSSRAQPTPRPSALSLLASRGTAVRLQGLPDGGSKGNRSMHYEPLPDDFRRFREALELLMHSDSVAVVVSACSSIQCLFPPASWDCVVMPLLRCMYTSPGDMREPILRVIAAFVSVLPRLFQPHMREFFLKQSDTFPVRQQKLSLLLSLALSDPSCLSFLLPELKVYIHWAGDERLTASVFRVLTLLALQHRQAQAFCMRLFVSLLDSESHNVAAEAVVGVRTLVQQKQDEQDGETLARLVLHLAAQLSKLSSPAARSSVVWVVGKYHMQVSWVAADALRQLTRGFREEADEVKLQILLLATRLWAFHLRNMKEGPPGGGPGDGQTPQEGALHDAEQRLIPPPTREQSRQNFPRLDAMLRFLMEMALYDVSNDVRDMGRVYSALTSVLSQPEESLPEEQKDMRRFAEQYLHSLSTSAPSPVPQSPKKLEEDGLLGCERPLQGREALWPWSYMAFYTGLTFPGDIALPPFAAEDSPASLRQCLSEEEALRQSFLSLGVKPPKAGGLWGGTSPTAHGPRSICSADVIRQENAASLMGRIDGGRAPLSQSELDSFYENDPLVDLAHLNGPSSSSANSTECTGTRSSGLGTLEAGSVEKHNEAIWAAFEGGGEAGEDTEAEGSPRVTPVEGLVIGEDDESEEERTMQSPQQKTETSTPPSYPCQEGSEADRTDVNWGFSPVVS